MGNIYKTGQSMQMGAAGASIPRNETASSDDEGYDPFGGAAFPPSLDFDSTIKNAIAPDFSHLNITPSESEAPIHKLQFGKGVTMTLLNFSKMDSSTPTEQQVPPNPTLIPTPQAQQEPVSMPDLVESFTFPNGTTIYLKNGQLHRDNGPAIEFPGGMGSVFFQHGRLHRNNGPAISWPYEEDCQWFKHGMRIRSTYETKDNIKMLREKMLNEKLKPNKPQD